MTGDGQLRLPPDATAGDADALIPPLIRDLTTVVAAVFDLTGCCRAANRGFAFLLDRDAPPAAGELVGRWFVQPDFQHLLAVTDPLTGAANRRCFAERCRDEIEEASEVSGYRLALIAADLDFFKKVNDSFGHDVGDRALIAFTEAMRAKTRDDDLVVRLGGEEFCVLLPKTARSRDPEVSCAGCRRGWLPAPPPVRRCARRRCSRR